FTYTWADLSNPSNCTVNSTGATSYYIGMNSLSASAVISALQELPAVLKSLSDTPFLGQDMALLGPSLGSTVSLGTVFNTDLQNSTAITNGSELIFLMQNLQNGFGGASFVSADYNSSGFEIKFDVPQSYNGSVNWQISQPLDGAQLQASGTAPAAISYLA